MRDCKWCHSCSCTCDLLLTSTKKRIVNLLAVFMQIETGDSILALQHIDFRWYMYADMKCMIQVKLIINKWEEEYTEDALLKLWILVKPDDCRHCSLTVSWLKSASICTMKWNSTWTWSSILSAEWLRSPASAVHSSRSSTVATMKAVLNTLSLSSVSFYFSLVSRRTAEHASDFLQNKCIMHNTLVGITVSIM